MHYETKACFFFFSAPSVFLDWIINDPRLTFAFLITGEMALSLSLPLSDSAGIQLRVSFFFFWRRNPNARSRLKCRNVFEHRRPRKIRILKTHWDFFFKIICVCRVVQWRRQSRADVPWKRSHERHHSVSIVLLKRARERKRERRHRHQLSYWQKVRKRFGGWLSH